MELKRVEIAGFKSFPDRVEVAFDKGITAIVGPNGSGKSNIADAVRWVLGEQSARTLRGSKMEDVIFAGTARRKPLGFAEVTLVLDNRDKQVKIDYDEIAIRRRLFRSGESEYAINDAKCRLKDIQEILMDTGIGKDGYSMIGQGQIDRLLSSKPQDRRLIFEEAAGITKFKTRREEAEKKLSNEEQQLVRVEDILMELRSREDNLRFQAETAEKYLKLKDELKLYEVSAFIGEYDQLQSQYNKVEEQLNQVLDQITDAREAQAKSREISDRLSKESGEARAILNSFNDQLRELMLEQEKAEGDRRVMESQKTHHTEEVQQLTVRIEEIKNKIHDREETMKKEEARALEFQKELDEKTDALLDLQRDMRLLSEEITEKQRILEGCRREGTQLSQDMIELKMNQERQKVQSEQIEKDSENYEAEKDTLSEDILQAEKSLDELESKRNEILLTQEELKTTMDEQTESLKKVEETIRSIREEQENAMLQMKDLTRKVQWLRSLEEEYEGFSGPVKSVMKQKASYGRKIRGTVSDVIAFDKEYMVAMENALGAQVQNIVVEDTKTAKSLVEYLRRSQGGRATFLPMDAVVGRGPVREADAVRSMNGVIGFANELVRALPEYSKILDRLLGNVIIADSFDHGSAVSKKYGQFLRVVTLDGDIFNIGGSITGGSNKQKGNNLLERRTESEELKKQLNELRSDADRLQKTVSAKNQEKFGLSAALDANRKKQAEITAEILKIDQEKRQAEYIRSQAENRLNMLEESFRTHADSMEQQEEQSRLVQEKIDAQQAKIDEHNEKIAAMENELDEMLASMNSKKEEEGRSTIAIAGVRQQKQFMEQSKAWEQKEIEALGLEADQAMQQRIDLTMEERGTTDEIQKISVSIEELQQKIDAKSEEIQKQTLKVDQTDAQREESLRANESQLKAAAALEKEQVRMEAQLQRAKKDLDDLQERMWNEYEMTYGSAKDLAAGGFANDERMQEAASLSKTKRHQNIVRVRNEIRDLGNVNVGAIEEYKALSERLTFLTTQHDDIVKSADDLREIIQRMTERMEKQFSEGFAKVAQAFNVVFTQMFGGGQGVLKLTEGENELEAGIEINVQPPGKKLQSMMLLSGGERALTAIALLFAIQQLNPAPFCILDEIEAALDDANVDRYADFLRQMTGNTQFIIITHRKGTMNAADTMYGVTMEEKGVSKCISVKFADANLTE